MKGIDIDNILLLRKKYLFVTKVIENGNKYLS